MNWYFEVLKKYATLVLIPIIGWIALFVFVCLDSAPGSNQYGENPKGA